MPREFVNTVADFGRDDELVVIRPELARGDACEAEFVVAVLTETDGEGLDRARGVARHEADDGARINAARKKRAERNVRDETQAHGLFQ